MSNEKPPQTKQPSRPEAIPIRILRFISPTNIPGKNSATSCTHTESTNKARYTMEFQPWLRHVRIAYCGPGVDSREEVVMAHESRIECWEPL